MCLIHARTLEQRGAPWAFFLKILTVTGFLCQAWCRLKSIGEELFKGALYIYISTACFYILTIGLYLADEF